MLAAHRLVPALEFARSVGDAGEWRAIVGSLNRLLASLAAQWYAVYWQMADGRRRPILVRRCPPDVLDQPAPPPKRVLRGSGGAREVRLEARRTPETAESIVCRAMFGGDWRGTARAERAIVALVQQSLERLLSLAAEERRSRARDLIASDTGRLLFLFTARADLLDAPAAAGFPVDAVHRMAQQIAGSHGRGEGGDVAWNGRVYDLTHRWVRGDRGSRARLLAIEARRRESVPELVSAQLERYALTRREAQVAHLLLHGYTNQQMAAHLFVSVDTVKTHCRHLFSKLEIGRRSEILKVLSRDEADRPPVDATTIRPVRRERAPVRFGKKPILGAFWRDRYVRLESGAAFFSSVRDGTPVRIEKGAVGYCYGEAGSLVLGFNRDMKQPSVPAFGPPRFDYQVQLEPRLVPFLSVSLD